MSELLNLFLFISLIICIFFVALIKSEYDFTRTSSKMKKSVHAPWSLHEFLSQSNLGGKREYYRFHEETVRSHTHRYLGRFDSAILHREELAVLDIIIERKFPVNSLPEKAKKEDMFQAGLYGLALSESGVYCSNAYLAVIYCIQDTAKRCLEQNSTNKCWKCREGKSFIQQYNESEIKKHLKRLDEVWYGKRKPKASPYASKCASCPYSRDGTCNYSVI